MSRRGRFAVILLVALAASAGSALALVEGMRTDPVKAHWSGTVKCDIGVGQGLTCNFDTPVYAEFFTGIATTEQYEVQILIPGIEPPVVVADGIVGGDSSSHVWVRCTLAVRLPDSIIKGRTYVVQWSLGGGTDSLTYYYDSTNTYGWGEIVLPGQSVQTDDPRDLCMRLYGVMKPISRYLFGFNLSPQVLNVPFSTLRAHADSARVGLSRTEIPWTWLQSEPGTWSAAEVDYLVSLIHDSLDCEIVGILAYCPEWASSRTDGSEKCPPRGLFADVWDDTNYFARYVEFAVKRYKDRIQAWECWNEPHMLGEYWQFPDTPYYYVEPCDTTAMCSLYFRLCAVADSVIDSINRIGVGDSDGLFVLSGSADLAERIKWIRDFYGFAESTGIFWDGVTAHPYDLKHTPSGNFQPALFEAAAETLRKIMRDENGDMGELWITEIGWRGMEGVLGQQELQARNLAEVFVMAKATEARAVGGFDRICWYSFLDGTGEPPHGGMGLIETDHVPKPSLYASGQTAAHLVGKRLDGRVLSGDQGDDAVTRVYEFEDPATGKRRWVCWRNGDARYGDREPPPVDASIPVRTDVVEWEYCAYGPDNPGYQEASAADGWFDLSLTTRPRFIFEPVNAPIRRPDLVVDSIRVEPEQPQAGMPMFITAWVRNHGNGFVPTNSSGWVDFCWNDSLLRRFSTFWPDSVPGGGGELVFSIESVPSSMRGSGLLRVTANPGREFVELDHDNNSSFRAVTVHGRSER